MLERLEQEGYEPLHDVGCEWATKRQPCRTFSVDGTRLGAMVAHTMGTTDEEKIKAAGYIYRKEGGVWQIDGPRLTGMEEEQADWEEGLDED